MYVYFYVYIYTFIIHISTLSHGWFFIPWFLKPRLSLRALPAYPLRVGPHSCQVIAANCESTRMSVIDINGVARLDISTSGCIGVWVMSRCPKNGGISMDIPVIAWWDITIGVIMGYNGMLWNRISHMDPYGVFVGIPTNKGNFTSNGFFRSFKKLFCRYLGYNGMLMGYITNPFDIWMCHAGYPDLLVLMGQFVIINHGICAGHKAQMGFLNAFWIR